MKAGPLDRRVTILRRVQSAPDALNEPTTTYEPIATVWAQRLDVRGEERFGSGREFSVMAATFRMRFTDLRTTDRLECEGLTYNVIGVKEIGRRAGLEVAAEWLE